VLQNKLPDGLTPHCCIRTI